MAEVWVLVLLTASPAYHDDGLPRHYFPADAAFFEPNATGLS